MTITLNGERHSFDDAALALEELLTRLKLEPRSLLIEHNGTALNRSEWSQRTVRDGDSLEILRIAAGG